MMSNERLETSDMPVPERDNAAPIQISVSARLAHTLRHGFWVALGLGLLVWFLYLVREIWLPLAIAFLIAMVLDPVVDRMEARGWSRLKGSLLIFFSFFAVVGATLYFAVPAVVHQAQEISGQIQQYLPTPGDPKSDAKAQKSLNKMLDKSNAPPFVRMAVERGTVQLSETITRSTNWLSAHAMEVLSNLIWLVIIPIVTFYALKDFHLIFAKSLLLVPRQKRDFVQTMVAEVTAIFGKFLRGLMLVSALNGAATWVLLMLLRTPNAFTLGAIAGVLYTVPYLGAVLTIVLVAGVALMHGGLQYMLLVVVLNVLLHQFLFDQIITPRILGGHVGLHPILSIVALLAGNVLLGILGMLLAVPVAASIQMVILTMVPKLRHEIDIPNNIHELPDSVASLERETKKTQMDRDATEELHRSVSEAVDHIEAKAGAEEPAPADGQYGDSASEPPPARTANDTA
jgi:predicted PurR-regulated permease PerM